jgi:uncharacterized delta-60 repeat protein
MQRTMRKFGVLGALVMLFLPQVPAHGETVVQAWVQRYSAPPYGYAATQTDATIDSSNSVIVTGYWTYPNAYADYVTIKYSSSGVPVWTNYYNGPGNGDDEALAMTVDSKDNVIVTGYSAGLSATPYNYDYATIKYSKDGVALWTNRYNGTGNNTDWGTAVAVDTNDDVIVTGRSTGQANFDYATIKYSSGGAPIWTNRYHGQGVLGMSDVPHALAVDGNNDVIVTGVSARVGATTPEYATIKYSSDGVALWTNRYAAYRTYGAYPYGLAVDRDNNIFVTGEGAFTNSPDYATIKYSSVGLPLWTNYYDGRRHGDDRANVIKVDGNGDVIVTGTSWESGLHTEYTTIKYSSAGVSLWTNHYRGPTTSWHDDVATAAAVDSINNVVVTGNSTSSQGDYDYATIKYTSDGLALWTNRYSGGYGYDYSQQVRVDYNGDVIVAGYSMGSPARDEFATIKYIFPLLITSCQMTNGILGVQADNVQPGPLVIEACTDLASWLPIFTNTTPTNVLFYTDPDAGNYPGRFYRAFQSP